MRTYERLRDTLSFYGVNCNEPYYISSGYPISEFPERPFRIDFYAFCICIAGSIELDIDNTKYSIRKNYCFISAPSTIINFREISTDFRMRLLFFEKDFLLRNISNPFILDKMNLFRKGSYNIVQTADDEAGTLLNLFDYLQQKVLSRDLFVKDIVRTIIFNILLEMAGMVNLKCPGTEEKVLYKNDLFLKFDALVKLNILRHKDVGFYADRLHISDKYLIQLVKNATGKTPHQIIDEALLKEAYVMLGNPENNITQIAEVLQFSSVSAFGRFFKKYASISPTEYRKR